MNTTTTTERRKRFSPQNKTFTVRVKRDNIDNAVVRNSSLCMTADAIQQAMPWAKHISVDTQSIRFSDPKSKKRFVFLTPANAQRAILEYDSGQKPAPFSFQLNLDHGYARPMRSQQAGFTRPERGVVIKKTKTPARRLMPAREREFGLRKLVSRGMPSAKQLAAQLTERSASVTPTQFTAARKRVEIENRAARKLGLPAPVEPRSPRNKGVR